MKRVSSLIAVISSLIFGIVWSAPQKTSSKDAYITRYDYDNPGLGNYSFRVETSDGFKHEQTGKLNNIDTDQETLVMSGSYSYIGSDGQTYAVHYIADENGFQPRSERMPSSFGEPPLIHSTTGEEEEPKTHDASPSATDERSKDCYSKYSSALCNLLRR